MKKLDIRFLTLSFIVLNLLFFSFVHGVFRLQLFKQTVNSELLEKLQVETLRMAGEYQDIQDQAALSEIRILQGNKQRSQFVVEQTSGLINAVLEQNGPVITQEDKVLLKDFLSEYNSKPEHCFWIFDDAGLLVLGPRVNLTDVNPADGKSLVDSVRIHSTGYISLPGENGLPDNPGYGRQISTLGWTLVSFQPWSVLERKIQGLESLKKFRTDRLISQVGKNGSAGVVDKDLNIVEYTYAQQKGRPVDDLTLEGPLPPSKLLFNKIDGIRNYVIFDPISNHGKYRQAYMHTDEKTGDTYFISQNKRELFKEIDQRSSPLLGYLGGLSLLLLVINTFYVLRELLARKNPNEEPS